MRPPHRPFINYGIIRCWACQTVLLLMLLGHQRAAAQERSQLDVELRGLLNTFYSDFNTPEHYDKAVHELATRPEFKPKLLELLQREYFQTVKGVDRKPIIEALGPLTHRKDLSEEEQRVFTDELERLINAPPKEDSFLNGGINLLAHYPSPEHEDLVLRFLNRPQNQDYTIVEAYKTLSVIGGPRSLEIMRQVADRLRKNFESGDWFIVELDGRIAALETRLKQETATVRPQTASASVQVMPSAAGTPPASPEPAPDSTTDSRVWLALLGGLILVIALSCRVFRKR